jgi:hypothetical protein
MTRQEFLDGVSFRVKGIHTDKGSSTYYYSDGTLTKQIRSGIDERALTDDYHLNVEDVSDNGFKGFVFVVDKKVEVEYKFGDLVVFE